MQPSNDAPNPSNDDAGSDLVDEATIESDEKAARQGKEAGRGPTPSEEETADRIAPEQPDIADDYRDMTEKGANAKGEGRIT